MCRLIKQKLESMQLNLCQTEVKINKLKIKTLGKIYDCPKILF